MSARLVARLFGLTGQPGPPPRSTADKLLARCPRGRLVRTVAWYAHEQDKNRFRPYVLVEGVRALGRGFRDLYEVDGPPPGARLLGATFPTPAAPAIALRGARWGKGWLKPAAAYGATARPEIELAAAWLAATAGCIEHDDCLLDPELARLCSHDRQTEVA